MREKLQRNEERADRPHPSADMQSKSWREQIAPLESTSNDLGAEVAELTAKAESERAKLERELERKGIINLKTKNVALLSSTVQYFSTIFDSLSSELEVLQKLE